MHDLGAHVSLICLYWFGCIIRVLGWWGASEEKERGESFEAGSRLSRIHHTCSRLSGRAPNVDRHDSARSTRDRGRGGTGEQSGVEALNSDRRAPLEGFVLQGDCGRCPSTSASQAHVDNFCFSLFSLFLNRIHYGATTLRWGYSGACACLLARYAPQTRGSSLGERDAHRRRSHDQPHQSLPMRGWKLQKIKFSRTTSHPASFNATRVIAST